MLQHETASKFFLHSREQRFSFEDDLVKIYLDEVLHQTLLGEARTFTIVAKAVGKVVYGDA